MIYEYDRWHSMSYNSILKELNEALEKAETTEKDFDEVQNTIKQTDSLRTRVKKKTSNFQKIIIIKQYNKLKMENTLKLPTYSILKSKI